MFGYYVPKTFEVCILNNDDCTEHTFTFESIYPYKDAGWYDDLEVVLYEHFNVFIDYQVLSFAMVVV